MSGASVRARPVTIVLADDDPEDRMMAEEALRECQVANDIVHVEDGEELLELLRGRGRFEGTHGPRPGLILLDLNMPRMDGREALKEIKSDAQLRRIPVVILTTSKAEEDIVRSYDLGGNSYITKPVTFEGLVEVMKELGRYWFEIVDLPEDARARA